MGRVQRLLGADGLLGAAVRARRQRPPMSRTASPAMPDDHRGGPRRSQRARRAAVRAGGRIPDRAGPRYAVVLDLPLNELTILRLREETGISLARRLADEGHRRAADDRAAVGARPRRRRPPMPGRAPFSRRGSRSSSSPIGRPDAPAPPRVSIMLNVAEIYARLVAARGFGQLLVLVIFVVGVLFLIIQFVALLIGLALARSITGSVHELFVGTERVRQGDFSHRIAVHGEDQLGRAGRLVQHDDGAAHVAAGRDGGEEAARGGAAHRPATSRCRCCRRARRCECPGVSLTAHLSSRRARSAATTTTSCRSTTTALGLLIADVSGKGTSAALYMAELKGLMLSLSQIHRSPRDLLIAANRIISAHLDSRSFITMTYAVLDLDARTMTCARAGHTPLIHLPGGARRRARRAHPRARRHGARAEARQRRAVRAAARGGHDAARRRRPVRVLHRRHQRADERTPRTCSASRGSARSSSSTRPAVRRAARAHPARGARVRRRRAAARRHDVHPAEGRRRAVRGRRIGRRAGRRCWCDQRLARHLPHPLRHRGERRGAGCSRRTASRSCARSRHAVGLPASAWRACGEVRIAVPPDEADEAARLIESHRAEPDGARGDPHPRRVRAARAAPRLPLPRSRPARARADAQVARARGRERRRRRQRVARVPRRRGARASSSPTCCSASSRTSTRGRSRRSRRRSSRRRRWRCMAEQLGLGEHLLLGRGEEKTGGRRKQALLADACEALIAAIYPRRRPRAGARVSSSASCRTRSRACARRSSCATSSRRCRSGCRRTDRPLPDYVITRATGPDHDKLFHVEVRVARRDARRGERPDEEGSGAGSGRLALASSTR